MIKFAKEFLRCVVRVDDVNGPKTLDKIEWCDLYKLIDPLSWNLRRRRKSLHMPS
jgi:hypothetical protein